MSAGESLMPSAQTEDAKAELGIDAQFSRDADHVAVTTAPVVVGLTKEELEHYRNDPKYKVLRWALFVLFWLTWVALFAAAIVLIVMSPRVDVNADKAWYSVANTYEIFVPSFKDSDGDTIGDFKGIEEKLKYFTDLKVDTLLLTSVFEYYKDDFGPRKVASYDTIGTRVGGKDQLVNLVKAAAGSDIKLVVDIPLNVSPNSTYSRTPYVKNNFLNMSNPESHTVILRSVKLLKDIGVNGVYIHGDNFSDISVTGYNDLISKIHQQVNDDDFAVFVGCQNTDACLKLNASVIVKDPHDQRTPTPQSIINAHLAYANQTLIGNTSVTCLGNSVYRERFVLPKTSADDHTNFASLLNALRLFIYPTAHTLYGDEYGLENTGAGEEPQLGLMHWEGESDGFSDSTLSRFFSKLQGYFSPGFPYSSHKVQERFQGLGNLRHKLRFAKLNFTSENSVVRYSHDNIYYVLAFNKGNETIDLRYSSLVNANMTEQLQHASRVHENGEDSDKIIDATEGTLSLEGYGYQILKIAP